MTRDKTLSDRRKNSRGYTLIEMAISIIIIGLIIASMAQAYMIYQRQEDIRITDDNLKAA